MSAAVGDDPESVDRRSVRAADTEGDAGGNAEASNFNGPRGKKNDMGMEDEEPRPSRLKRIWAKLDLDLGTLLMMFK